MIKKLLLATAIVGVMPTIATANAQDILDHIKSAVDLEWDLADKSEAWHIEGSYASNNNLENHTYHFDNYLGEGAWEDSAQQGTFEDFLWHVSEQASQAYSWNHDVNVVTTENGLTFQVFGYGIDSDEIEYVAFGQDFPSIINSIFENGFKKGFEHGYETGFQHGYAAGYEDGYDEAMAGLPRKH